MLGRPLFFSELIITVADGYVDEVGRREGRKAYFTG